MTQYETNPETHKSFVESKIVWMVRNIEPYSD